MRHLSIRWSISRAHGYEGQNVVTVTDEGAEGRARKRFTQMGGGYDLERTALAEWLQVAQQDKLRKLASRCRIIYSGKGAGEHEYNDAPDALHGMGRTPGGDGITIDPASDGELDKIAEAIGLKITPVYVRTARTRHAKRVGWDIEGC